MQCLECNVENRPGRRFCAECGAALPGACPACGFPNAQAERFCGGCGAPLAASPAESRPAAAPDGDGERRPITVLFADLCGYTRMSQKLDPEDVHALLERYFSIVDDIVVRCGGSVDKHIGDAVMGVFGAPVAHGDDAVRAVRAAAEIQKAIPGLAAETRQPLAVHIGIAAGEVVASGLGSGQHRAYTVIGQSVNLASRLVDLAGPGETILDESVQAAVQKIVRSEAMEGARARGIDAPLRVFRLGDDALAVPRDQGQPFVGREAELAQLATALASCRTGHRGGTVYVRGEAGMGKSRLVDELRRIARSQGFASHTALVLDFGMAKGRDAIREIAAALTGIPHSAEDEARRAALNRASDGDARLAELRPFLADLLELPPPDESRALYEAMDNTARQRGRAEAAVRLLEVGCGRQPVLIVVEDVHWADRVTLEYLAALTRGVGALPAVLVLTSRLEGDPLDPGWRASVQGAPFMTIDLGPLGLREALALAGGMLSTSSGFAEKCVERAGGNPLFLEQLMRDADENAERLPASLHSLVLARMDRLPERDRAGLRAAAVIGQRFDLPLLRKLANMPDYACDGLVAHYLIRPEGDEFLFAHALIRDGVYASLTRSRRAELHRVAAGWYGDRDPALKAEHLDRAESPEAPRAYLAAANAQAAAFHLERALEMADRGAVLARDREDIHALNMVRGSLRFDGGEGAPAVDAYMLALAAASAPDGRCRALLGIAAGHRLTANLDPAFAALAEAEPIARAHVLTRELAELHYTRGNLHFARASAAQCRAEHEAAFACAQSLGDPEWEARALSGLADADYAAGRMRTALDGFTRCVAFCEAHGMTRVAIPNRIMMGHCRCYLAEFDAGPAEIRAGLAQAVKVGDKHAEMFALESLGVLLTACGRYEEAEPALRRSLALAEAVGARRYQAVDLACLAECLLIRGRGAEALETIERALSLARETGMAFGGPIILGLRQRIVDDAGERKRCEAEAEELFASGSIGHNQIGYRRHVIEDALARCDWPRALAHATALEEYTRAEPLPSCTFIIARARVIAGLAAHPDDPEARREIARLKAEAARLNWPITWPSTEALTD